MITQVAEYNPGQPPDVKTVPLPPGYVRVWEGAVRPNDCHLRWDLFYRTGEVDWIEITPAKVFEILMDPEHMNDTAPWYGCLIRKGTKDIGRPCPRCGLRSRDDPDDDLCSNCVVEAYEQKEKSE